MRINPDQLVSRLRSLAPVALLLLAACSSGGGDTPATQTPTYAIGGSVSGLTGAGLVLQNNGADNLSISANGPFAFTTKLADGAAFNVTVLTQPAGQTCTASSNTGTVAAANITSVVVTCSANPPHTIGGSVSGLTGTGLVLQNNGADNLSISADGAFFFNTPVADGGGYAVTVLTQPAGQTCSVSSGTGSNVVTNITTVAVTCSAITYSIRVTVSGLAAGQTVTLQNNGADNFTSGNQTFSFYTRIADGAGYNVTVLNQPTTQTCTPSNNTGIVAGADVTVQVICSTNTWTIGGAVSGLTGTGLVLQNNGADNLGISADGAFFFNTPVAQGGGYAVTVLTQPTGQLCTVANGTGSNVVANITNVAVSCVNTYTIGGTITGTMAGNGPTLQNNRGDDLFIPAISTTSAPFTFSTPVVDGGAYAVTQLTRASAPTQDCVVTGGDDNAGGGTVAGANVTSVVVSCTATTIVPKFAYVTNSLADPVVGAADTVSAYSIASSTGALTPIGTVATGDEPYSVAVEPYGQFAYVANRSADSISVYSINPISGALTLSDADGAFPGPQDWVTTGDDAPISVTIHPSGQFAYVVNQGNGSSTGNTISAYRIDAAGALIPIDADGSALGVQTIATGTYPYAITVDPTGRFVYVANYNSHDVSAYTVDQTSGALTAVGSPVAAGTNPSSVAIDPTGKFAFVANGGTDNNVSAYTIDQTSGALTAVTGGPFPAGAAPRSVAVDPSGQYVYVANAASANVSVYTINPSSGALTAGTPVSAGATPFSVSVDPSGQYVYVANFGVVDPQNGNFTTPSSISTYSIGASGVLSPVGTTPTGNGATSVTTTQ